MKQWKTVLKITAVVDKWNKKRTKDHQFVNQKLGKSIVLYDKYSVFNLLAVNARLVKLYH